MPHQIIPLADVHPDAIEALLDDAFGRDRHSRTAYRIRAGLDPVAALSFGMVEGAALIGSLQSWPVQVAGAPLVLVGPVAVTPGLQGSGIGSALMDRLIAVAPSMPMTMIGDAGYYERWGFSSAATAGWSVPGPVERHRLLARAAGALPAVGTIGPCVAADRFALAALAA